MDLGDHSLRLDCDLSQLATARAWLASQLTAAGLEPGDALLAMTELATNAIRHAQSRPTISVDTTGDTLRIEVSDAQQTPPVVQPQPSASGGYGLRLVEAMASAWGWTPMATGKTVWIELAKEAVGTPPTRLRPTGDDG